MAQEDTGLVKRGLLLLALMSALVIVLLIIMFQRGGPAVPKTPNRPELYAADIVRVGVPFPAALSWPTLHALGEALPSTPGWEVRYNAVAAITRLGFADVPWPILEEMLDENRQMRNFRVQLQDGKEVPDEAAARLTLLSALRALTDWHKKQTEKREVTRDQARVYAAVDRLYESPILEIKTQADRTRKTFFR
jgi:hypothetical protein